MIQLKSVNLTQLPERESTILHLSDAADLRWAGMISLPPNTALPFDAGTRNEFYVLGGSLTEKGSAHASGTFLSRDNAADLHAGPQGAALFSYRHRLAPNGINETVASGDRNWTQGGAGGMQVAQLSLVHHRLMLVSWRPGTRIGPHAHPWGEEIFVLAGELCDQYGRYPAGTWQRLHPGAIHAPYAEVDTTILLRNGHLRT